MLSVICNEVLQPRILKAASEDRVHDTKSQPNSGNKPIKSPYGSVLRRKISCEGQLQQT